MIRRAAARLPWPAFALATFVWPAAAMADGEEDRRVHQILTVQELKVAGALQARDFDGLAGAESRIYADVGPSMRTRSKDESACLPAARTLAMLSGVSASRLVQAPDPVIARATLGTADDFARQMAACEKAAGVSPSARPPFDVYLRRLDQ